MKNLLGIGEAAEMCGIHTDTLRDWENKGYILPIRTAGGHRRYLRKDIENLNQSVYNKLSEVNFCRIKTKEIFTMKISRIPRENELVLINGDYGKVEKIINEYSGNESKLIIFITDATDTEKAKYIV